ncbi:hypothetical protein [Agrococcus jenensis]|uniref:Uncharacterized protein n=1 Tax=Agrococcus jenensis TaxID=46353 RepID=A0A3N2AT94_9MICO|nr:hypothetical protein [Agrococcus jenensis]ROR65992.1 hypothetical protein EDD26_1367 [Agrococcus jenensis]
MTTSLREALGATDPQFDITLPAGWVRMDASDASRDALLAQARARFLTAQRPDLWAQVRASIDRAFEELRRVRGEAIMLQLESGDDAPFVPASITATILSAEQGLDDHMAQLIAGGATALDGDRRFVRSESTDEVSQDGVRLGVTTVHYFTPVPGTRRRRALALSAVMPHPPGIDPDDRLLAATRLLLDAHVSTVRWRRSEAGA